MDRLASDDAILTCDSGTIATWAARHWRIRGDRQFLLSGNLATMAPELPYAMAAQWAHSGRQCIAFIGGGGGLAMLMAELDTAVRYNLPITVIVNNNASLGQIEWQQVVLGYPEGSAPSAASTSPRSPRLQRLRGPGRAGRRPRGRGPGRPRPCRPCPGRRSRQLPRAPLPGEIEFTQAKGFAEAFLRGQPNKLATARTPVKDKIDKLRS